MIADPRYPIGQYVPNQNPSQVQLKSWIEDIESFPTKLKRVLTNLGETELEWTYRLGSWSIKQIVHHCADSHMNSLIRFKWALTEDSPIIKAYFEDRWAKLEDSNTSNLVASLEIISGLHQRWTILLKSLSQSELNKTFIHPENNREISLKENIGNYSWHCNHHLAHIYQAIELNSVKS